MHVGISGVAYERNDLATAAHHLQLSRELGDAAGLPQNPYRWRAAEARLLAAQGDLPGAIEVLDEAEQVYFGDFAPNVRPVAAQRTGCSSPGDLASATSWAAAHELAPDDELSYLREFEHITLAMVLLAQHLAGRSPAALHVARQLLERLLAAAEAGGRTGNVIEIWCSWRWRPRPKVTGRVPRTCSVVPWPWASARATSGSSSTRDQPWPRCCTASRRSAGGRTRAQLSPPARRNRRGATSLPAAHRGTAQPLVDSLSERELEVLRLLDSDLGGPDIARELSVSVNTVRTHTRHIYAKLGATTRREAVREAARLGLLGHPSR